jgi:hypothetical protein
LDFGVGVLILNASERLLYAEIRNDVPEKTFDRCKLPPGGRKNQLKLGDVDTACFGTDELAVKITAVKNFYCVYRAFSCLGDTMLGGRSEEMKGVRTSDLPR